MSWRGYSRTEMRGGIVMAKCGQRSPAGHRQAYCPVCDNLEQISQDQPDTAYEIEVGAIFDKLDRISRIRRQYGQRHGR